MVRVQEGRRAWQGNQVARDSQRAVNTPWEGAKDELRTPPTSSLQRCYFGEREYMQCSAQGEGSPPPPRGQLDHLLPALCPAIFTGPATSPATALPFPLGKSCP